MSVPPEATPRVRQTVSATRGLSPVTILTVMPSSARRAIDAAADGLGWSRNTRNPARCRSCSSSAVSAVSSGAARVAMATTRLPARELARRARGVPRRGRRCSGRGPLRGRPW